MTRPDTIAIRDRITAVLADADRPLTTNEVCDLAGPYFERRWGCHDWQHASTNPFARIVECDGQSHLMQLNLACCQRGYTILRQLEKAGLARREHTAGRRDVSWVATGARVSDELDELRAMWEASA